jgi:NitT/TauT family transport system substrate-binding protein
MRMPLNQQPIRLLTRREFLAKASSLGVASLLGLPRDGHAEPPPETTRIRFVRSPAICTAPQYLAEDFLRLEGFSEIKYVERTEPSLTRTLVAGQADFTILTAPETLPEIEEGLPIVLLAGVHAGCWELFGHEQIRAVRDLKGKAVATRGPGTTEHMFISSILAYVGIDPRTEIRWVTARTIPETMQVFIDGKADAFLAFPPQPQELRAKKVGRVILNTAQDRPWSQYFCCLIAANRTFLQEHPAATKRALRAILKAVDICAQDPGRAARYLGTKGYEQRYALALEVFEGVQYDRWRQSDPEDTVRFHALRLHDVGMIKADPRKIIAQGTDWRFLNELKKELKA